MNWLNIGAFTSLIFLIILRNLISLLPLSVRIDTFKKLIFTPLWLYRLNIILATSPIGDENNWLHEIEQSTWRGVWIVPNLKSFKEAEDTAVNNDLVILYIHGGGFCTGYSTMYMETFQLIINHLRKEHHIRASILSLEYSLAPESVWPKQCDEAMDAYRYLIGTLGIDPKKIVLAGDSAGANLVATTLLTIKNQTNNEQHLLPAGAALLSPWIDLTIDQASFATNGKYDIITPKHVATYVPYYIQNFNNLDRESQLSYLRNPLISPLHGNFSDTCPIFLAYSGKELLVTSIENLKLNLEKDGCNLTTLRRANEVHIWIVYSLMATSKQAYERDCKEFINWIASVLNENKNV